MSISWFFELDSLTEHVVRRLAEDEGISLSDMCRQIIREGAAERLYEIEQQKEYDEDAKRMQAEFKSLNLVSDEKDLN